MTEHPSLSPAAQRVASLRRRFDSGATRPYAWRMQQLQRLIDFLDEREAELMQAMKADSGKADFSAYVGDIVFVRSEAKFVMKRLKGWMKAQKVKSPLFMKPAKSYIRYEPMGVVLIIGAWNFPIHLTLGPLVGAIAGGNTVLLKPSEVSPAVSHVIARYLPDYLDPEAIQVMEGGIPETTDMLEQRFDKIFYTGNTAVGRIVSTAAARYLTPVTLELGGKNPCIVRPDANLAVTARRIIENKFGNNAGQVCVAPDYLLVHESVRAPLLALLKTTLTDFFGADPRQSSSYSRIINDRHMTRLKALLEGPTLFFGGDIDDSCNYFGPTILTDVSEDHPVMAEEIFGPILPVMSYRTDEEAIAFVRKREHPLAFYLFTEDRQAAERILDHTQSGGVGINCVMLHVGNHYLPFGGVGYSGTQAYHGWFSFENMTHRRAVVDKSTRVDPASQYPPFTDEENSKRKKFARWVLSGR